MAKFNNAKAQLLLHQPNTLLEELMINPWLESGQY